MSDKDDLMPDYYELYLKSKAEMDKKILGSSDKELELYKQFDKIITHCVHNEDASIFDAANECIEICKKTP